MSKRRSADRRALGRVAVRIAEGWCDVEYAVDAYGRARSADSPHAVAWSAPAAVRMATTDDPDAYPRILAMLDQAALDAHGCCFYSLRGRRTILRVVGACMASL